MERRLCWAAQLRSKEYCPDLARELGDPWIADLVSLQPSKCACRGGAPTRCNLTHCSDDALIRLGARAMSERSQQRGNSYWDRAGNLGYASPSAPKKSTIGWSAAIMLNQSPLWEAVTCRQSPRNVLSIASFNETTSTSLGACPLRL